MPPPVHPRHETPYVAIALTAVLGIIFVLLRTFEQLADTFVTAIIPFYALGVASIYVLRKKPDYAPPPIEGDFYRIAAVLNDGERALLKRVREFTEGVVAPVIEDYWSRDAFPFEIIPRMAEIGIGGVGYQGYGAAGGSWLLNGLVAMELARVDSSVATFWGVHTGLSAGSIYLCGDEAQKQRWLPAMMNLIRVWSKRASATGRNGRSDCHAKNS